MLDNALMCGMTPDEFWYGDPQLYYNYSRVFEQKQKLEQQNIWAFGVRVCQALQSTPIIAGLANRQILNSMPKYPECPYNDTTSEEITEDKQALALAQFKARMFSWAGIVENKKE